MISLFKRYRLNRTTRQARSMFGFMTVCQRIKPMTQVEFEFAQQSLEVAADWLYQQPLALKNAHVSDYVLDEQTQMGYQQELHQMFTHGVVPIAVTNCTEILLHSLALLPQDNSRFGIVNIGHHFELKQTLDLQVGSVFHYALSRFALAKLLCIGLDSEHAHPQTIEYAQDLGCDWVSYEECGFLNRSQLKAQLNHHMEQSDHLVLNIDLGCLVSGNRLDSHKVLDNQMVLSVLRHMLSSGKVRYIQLVGAKDKLIYSKQTKQIIDELISLAPQFVDAA